MSAEQPDEEVQQPSEDSTEDVEPTGDESAPATTQPDLLGPTGPRRLVPSPASDGIEQAVQQMERGDNRAARKTLVALKSDDELVVEQKEKLLAALRPDPFALGVVALALAIIITVALLAFNR